MNNNLKKEYTISELINFLNRHEGRKEDEIISVEKIRMNDEGLLEYNNNKLKMTDHALSQLISKIRTLAGLKASVMTVPYLKACPSDSRAYQLNNWIEKYIEKKESIENKIPSWMIRKNNGQIRGILSDNYSIFDNREVLKMLNKIPDANSLKFQNITLNNDQLFLRYIKKDLQIGDDETGLMAGWHLSNDEIGRRSLRLDFLVYQLICTNGLMGIKEYDNMFKQIHYGIKKEQITTKFEASLNMDEDKAMEVMTAFKNSENKMPNTDDIDLILSAVNKTFPIIGKDITEIAKENLKNYTDNKFSKYVLISSITEAARDLYSGDKRYDIERAAGRLLEKDKLYTDDSKIIFLNADDENSSPSVNVNNPHFNNPYPNGEVYNINESI